MTTQPPSRREARRTQARGKVSVIGIIGEILITGGVLVFLFLGWQLWLNDMVVGAVQDKAGIALSHSLSAGTPVHQAPITKDTTPKSYGQPIVATAPGNAQEFAVMYVPRFGATYSRPVSEGVGTADVLDKNGIGHYPGTQMPGQVGNFAVAAHRTTHGAPFGSLATLQVGDKIYLQTADGYYTYDFRGLEYVRPTGVGVLDAVPESPGVTATDRVMTMTSCNPRFSASERIIAYAVFESWQPTSAGPPAAIAAIVNASN